VDSRFLIFERFLNLIPKNKMMFKHLNQEDLDKADNILGSFGPHRIMPKTIGDGKMILGDGTRHVEPVRETCPIDEKLKKTMTVIFDSKTDPTFNSRVNLGINHHVSGMDAKPGVGGKMDKGEDDTEPWRLDEAQTNLDGVPRRLDVVVQQLDGDQRGSKQSSRRVKVVQGELWKLCGYVDVEVTKKKRNIFQKTKDVLKRFYYS